MKKILIIPLVILNIFRLLFRLLYIKIKKKIYGSKKWVLSDFLYLSWDVDYTKELWEKFFNYYNELSNRFDPLIIQLYSDKAKITTNRYYPWWQVRDITIQWIEWKKLTKTYLPLAEARKDISSFKILKIITNKDFIRIDWIRHSNFKDYDWWYYMIIKYEEWILKIIEEFSETKPI